MNRVRATVAAVIRYSGLLALWRFFHSKQIVILVAHGTAASRTDAEWIPLRPQLPPETLERCLRLLAASYRFVRFDDAVGMLAGQSEMQPRAIAITFDDGYRNNLLCALPVLRRYHARPMIFLTTGHIESRKPFWFDRLDFAIQSAAHVEGRTFRVGATRLQLRAGTRTEMASSYARLRRVAKSELRPDTAMLAELDTIAETLETEAGRRLADIFEADAYSSVVAWDQVRAASADADFGSHTVNHIRIPLVEKNRAEQELLDSKQQIEAETSLPCRHFAYPDGSFDLQAASLVRNCGYLSAVTMEPGLNRPGDDLMQLKRIPIPLHGTDSELLLELSGLMDWLASLRKRFSRGGQN